MHQLDLFTRLAEITGGQAPDDRIIDVVDQKDFLYGKSEQSARDGFVVYVGEDIFGAKWRNWKMLTKEFDDARGTGRIVEYGVPRFYNLYKDPQGPTWYSCWPTMSAGAISVPTVGATCAGCRRRASIPLPPGACN